MATSAPLPANKRPVMSRRVLTSGTTCASGEPVPSVSLYLHLQWRRRQLQYNLLRTVRCHIQAIGGTIERIFATHRRLKTHKLVIRRRHWLAPDLHIGKQVLSIAWSLGNDQGAEI